MLELWVILILLYYRLICCSSKIWFELIQWISSTRLCWATGEGTCGSRAFLISLILLCTAAYIPTKYIHFQYTIAIIIQIVTSHVPAMHRHFPWINDNLFTDFKLILKQINQSDWQLFPSNWQFHTYSVCRDLLIIIWLLSFCDTFSSAEINENVII